VSRRNLRAFVLPLLCYAYIAWYALRGSRPALRL